MTQLDNLHYTIRTLRSELAAAESEAAQWKENANMIAAEAERWKTKAEMLEEPLKRAWFVYKASDGQWYVRESSHGLLWLNILGEGPTALDALRRAVEATKTKG